MGETLKCSTPGGIGTRHSVHIQSGDKIFVQTKIQGTKSVHECPEPEIPQDAIIDGTNRYEAAYVVYTCKPGYKLVGTPLRKCLMGQWTGLTPVCDPPLRKIATQIYAEEGRMGVTSKDVAPEGSEDAALTLSQKVAKAAMEKQEIQEKLANLTEHVRVEQEKNMKKTMEEFKK